VFEIAALIHNVLSRGSAWKNDTNSFVVIDDKSTCEKPKSSHEEIVLLRRSANPPKGFRSECPMATESRKRNSSSCRLKRVARTGRIGVSPMIPSDKNLSVGIPPSKLIAVEGNIPRFKRVILHNGDLFADFFHFCLYHATQTTKSEHWMCAGFITNNSVHLNVKVEDGHSWLRFCSASRFAEAMM
jgi:hypothetical protein